MNLLICISTQSFFHVSFSNTCFSCASISIGKFLFSSYKRALSLFLFWLSFAAIFINMIAHNFPYTSIFPSVSRLDSRPETRQAIYSIYIYSRDKTIVLSAARSAKQVRIRTRYSPTFQVSFLTLHTPTSGQYKHSDYLDIIYQIKC